MARRFRSSASRSSIIFRRSARTITITSPRMCRCGRRMRSPTASRSRRCRAARGTCCNISWRGAARSPATCSNPMRCCARCPASTGPTSRSCFSPRAATRDTFPLPLGHGFVLSIVLLHPKSRGRLTLASPDPRAKPLVDPALLSAPDDIEPLVRGLRLARRVFATPAFAPYRATEFLPGPSVDGDARAARTTSAPRPRPCIIRPEAAAWASATTPWSRRS